MEEVCCRIAHAKRFLLEHCHVLFFPEFAGEDLARMDQDSLRFVLSFCIYFAVPFCLCLLRYHSTEVLGNLPTCR